MFLASRLRAAPMLSLLASLLLFPPALSGDIRLSREEEAALSQAGVFSRAFAAVAKIIRPAVVNIKVERQVLGPGGPFEFNNPFEYFDQLFGPGLPGILPPAPRSQIAQSQGTGVIIDNRGYILTNNHVVGDADAIRVFLLDGREFAAELIGADPNSDVAVIRIKADNFSVAKLGDSDLVEVGEWVMAVGNPFGLDFTITSGIVSARGRSGMGVMEIEDFIQTDASINPGNSGGPLVNLRGEVIGINTFIYSKKGSSSAGSIGLGFAIPSNIAKSVMQSLISHRQVTSSYLGAEVSFLNQEKALAKGLRAPRGALVESVARDGPADRAGFRRGDVVVRWGKREIADDKQFRNLVTVTTPGQPVEAEIIRDGKTVLLKVTLLDSAPQVSVEEKNSDRFLSALGIDIRDAKSDFLERMGYERGASGAMVAAVERNSPADRLGFRAGSLVIGFNGKEIRTSQELRNAIGAAGQASAYEITWRDGSLVHKAKLTMN